MSIPFIDLKTPYQAQKKRILERITQVLEHGQYIMGPEVVELEEKLSQFVGSKHCITCASGTDALVMALMACGVKAGDEVIVPAFSFVATAEAVVLCGATPVFVDIDKETYNIDTKSIEGAISEKTRAIMPVSLYGQPADMEEINTLAKRHHLVVIEDAAQSFGAEYKGEKSCHLADFGCTSFFPAKPLGCYGDGGAIFTDNDDWAQALKEIRNHGSGKRYFHTRIGLNGRMDTLQCAILLERLEKFDWEVAQRQKWAKRYTEALKPLSDQKVKVPTVREDRTSVYAQYTLWLENREDWQAKLQKQGVPTAVHYPLALSEQPAYKHWSTQPCLSSQQASEAVLSLPFHPYMTDEVFEKIVAAFRG